MKLKGNCEIFLNIRMNYGCLVLEFYVKKKLNVIRIFSEGGFIFCYLIEIRWYFFYKGGEWGLLIIY